jgi:hypothetical protein
MRNAERDYVVQANALQLELVNGEPRVILPEDRNGTGGDDLPATAYAHGQIADYVGIPRNYYRRMEAEKPHMLVGDVNDWIADKPSDEKRMVRAMGEIPDVSDPHIRAFVSDRFRRELSHFGLASRAFDILMGQGAELASSSVTETNLYLKFVAPWLEAEVPGSLVPNDVVRGGALIKNSEVGKGRLVVALWIDRLVCVNGMVLAETFSRIHVGKRIETEEVLEQILSDKTKNLSEAALWSTVEDVLKSLFDPEEFSAAVSMLGQTTTRKIESRELPKVVEVTRKKLRLPKSTDSDILSHLANGGDLSQWGLANAITRTAEDVESYDFATELEAAGGKLVALPEKDWNEIATAA